MKERLQEASAGYSQGGRVDRQVWECAAGGEERDCEEEDS